MESLRMKPSTTTKPHSLANLDALSMSLHKSPVLIDERESQSVFQGRPEQPQQKTQSLIMRGKQDQSKYVPFINERTPLGSLLEKP